MKRRDFLNLSGSAVPGLALLSCSKEANPIGPVLDLLIGEVQDLIDANVLDPEGNGLLGILNAVLSGVQNDRPSAVAQLNAFIRAVEGFISGGLLTAGEGQPLIGTAQVAIDQLNV